jgi:hypothetical protein
VVNYLWHPATISYCDRFAPGFNISRRWHAFRAAIVLFVAAAPDADRVWLQ